MASLAFGTGFALGVVSGATAALLTVGAIVLLVAVVGPVIYRAAVR